MPTPKASPKKTTTAGKLNKKVGPFPLKYWIGIGIAAVFILWLYLRHRGGNTVEGAGETATPLTPIYPQQAASAGTPSANTPISQGLSPDVLAQLGIGMPTDYVTGTDLQSQLDTLGSNVASQIAAATFSAVPSSTTAAPANTPVAVKTATGAPVKKTNPTTKKAPIKYYTYAPGKAPKGKKANEIPVVKGRKIQFKKGSGYYYA